mmetsp:Transcript_18890/g.43799  ORF Transcript_18890/g.43799 Transcript_18890/m.43799 type:complete len:289 (-) Transcript_18890:60-926(-)
MTTYEKSAYEKLRDKRIRQNEERMKQLGLDVSPLKRQLKARATKRRHASNATGKHTKQGQERRSRRLAFATNRGQERRSRRLASAAVATTKKKAKQRDDDLVILGYQDEVTRQRDYYDDNDDDNDGGGGGDGNNATVYQQPRRRNRRIAAEKLDLSAKDRKLLGGIEIERFLAKFREYLEFENKISEPNVRNVMRQATKFVHGEGVRYDSKVPGYSWPPGCYFMKGRSLKPMDDITELMKEGQKCEDEWGRDHGNGWLISHPFKKLHLFQEFILENPKFLKAKIRIKF